MTSLLKQLDRVKDMWSHWWRDLPLEGHGRRKRCIFMENDDTAAHLNQVPNLLVESGISYFLVAVDFKNQMVFKIKLGF